MEYTSRSRRIGHLEGKIIGLKTKQLIHSGTINFNQDDGVAVSSIKRQGYTTSKTRWGYSPGPSCAKAD